MPNMYKKDDDLKAKMEVLCLLADHRTVGGPSVKMRRLLGSRLVQGSTALCIYNKL